MKMLSEDDLDLAEMTDEELTAAWDFWFDLAQATNDFDPPWTHGVFVNLLWPAKDPELTMHGSERVTSRSDRSREQ